MKFAAIGDDGVRPIIWGLGATEEAALADAREHLPEDDVQVDLLVTCEVPLSVAQEIEAGNINPESLGIKVRCKAGRVIAAQYERPVVDPAHDCICIITPYARHEKPGCPVHRPAGG